MVYRENHVYVPVDSPKILYSTSEGHGTEYVDEA